MLGPYNFLYQSISHTLPPLGDLYFIIRIVAFCDSNEFYFHPDFYY